MNNDTRIIELRVENVKKIKAVQIRPVDGQPLIQITGRNGQGKTSILDAITYALGGKDTQPAKPVRDGAESASAIVETNEYIIERTWKADGKTALSVRNKDGAKYGTPQALLDAIVGDLTFDPLAFIRLKPADQVKTLKDLAGLDFDEIESLRAGAFDDRTGVNREHKAAAAQLAAAPPVDAPDEEINVAELTAKHAAATETLMANSTRRGQIERRRQQIQDGEKERAKTLVRFENEIEELKRKLAHMEADLATRREASTKLGEMEKVELEQITAELAQLTDPDITDLSNQIQQAETVNHRVRARKERAALEQKVATLKAESEALTARIEELDQKKQEMLLQAQLPIQGLSFGESGITLNGIPFDQASSAEQLRVSVAMGLALNPRLKVMLVRDGSLLDSAGRALLAEMAEASNAQVWMERATDGEAVGIVIEDGEIKADEPAAAAPTEAILQ